MLEESKELATVDKETIVKLRESSGEGNEQKPFVPIYQVDNTKVKEKVGEREVDVVCEPRWKILTKDENGEYVYNTIKSFGGSILKIMWQVKNDGEWDDKLKKMVANNAPFFASPLFSPSCFFGKKYINIKYSGQDGQIESLTYPELKAKYGEKFQLIGWVFVLHNNEVVRLKMTGSSRSVLFDFPKEFKANDSVSAHPIIFSAEYVEKPQPHNVAKFEVATDPNVPFSINDVIKYQAELDSMFNTSANKIMEAMGGEIVEEEPEEIDVQAIPFK